MSRIGGSRLLARLPSLEGNRPPLRLVCPATLMFVNRTGFPGDSIGWEIMESWED